jgi:hypothetical protein
MDDNNSSYHKVDWLTTYLGAMGHAVDCYAISGRENLLATAAIYRREYLELWKIASEYIT